MEQADIDELPVVAADGAVIGVVSSSDILRLHDLLEQANEDPRGLGV
jgi:predicted transcriptional regulator